MVANISPKFWAKVDKDGPIPTHRPELGPCWVWTGYKSKGYGRFESNLNTLQAHRYAWIKLVGPIPDGLTIDHLCLNRACVNPKHLEPVTRRENGLRAWRDFAPEPKQYCIRGHLLDEANTYHKPNRNSRQCRECIRIRARVYNARARGKA